MCRCLFHVTRTCVTRVTLSAAVVAVLILAMTSAAAPAEAQYFGRNKVQYDHFAFRILPTDHFRIHFYPAESLATADAARMAERWYTRHSRTLGHEFAESPLIFYADAPDFQQSNVVEGEISQGTGGITEGSRERVIMPFTGGYAEFDHVLGHELVHVFQYRIAAEGRNGLRSLNNIPLWLIEGMAEYLSLGRDDPNTAMWLRDALLRDDLPTLDQLTNDRRYFPYRYGQALWAYVGGTWGDESVNRLYRAALAEGWEKGVTATLGISADSLSKQWHAAIRRAYTPVLAGRSRPDSVGRGVAVVTDRGQQNISPAVSPDGRYMAYFSSRGLFGIDLYLADVATGRNIRQLTSVTNDRHFDALSFIGSAATWSPDGSQLAFVVYAAGDNEINIIDVASGRTLRRISVRGVTAMSDPAWSPDGMRIAYTGFSGGLSDLHVFDLQSGADRQLSNDREAQLQPSWSPDGRSLVFATDAGPTTDLSLLSFDATRLALMDVESGRVQLLPRFGGGKHINPQYAADGRSLFFVSDQDGVANVYRAMLPAFTVTRITNVVTGVSGISTLSPAISVARGTGALLFSVFDRQGYSIRQLDPAAVTAAAVARTAQGRPSALTDTVAAVAGILPPSDGRDGMVARYLADATTGLPAATPSDTRRYEGGLQLDYIGGPQFGVAVGGGYGTGISGGIAASFSDQLGNNSIQTVLQAQGDLKDIGGQMLYLNRARRWNWGGQAYHIPQVGGFATFDNTTVNVGGEVLPGTVYTRTLQRVFYDNAQAIAQYPLTATRRFEFSVGAQRISSSTQVDSLYDVGNTRVRETRRNFAGADALTFGTALAAFVGDYSFMGFTSPVAGGRYRFEVSPNVGTVNYTSLLADYRRYLLARPFTFAFRGMHFGRYGEGRGSEQLQSLFVGQPYFIRGYDANSFTLAECSAGVGSNECPQFSRLSGSRVAVLNAELRIPLLGTNQYGIIPFPYLPLEVSPFIDGGLAWSAGDDVDLRFARSSATRVPVFSTGVSMRANVLGYAVAEFYLAKPFQRDQKNWVFGFQLQPGW